LWLIGDFPTGTGLALLPDMPQFLPGIVPPHQGQARRANVWWRDDPVNTAQDQGTMSVPLACAKG